MLLTILLGFVLATLLVSSLCQGEKRNGVNHPKNYAKSLVADVLSGRSTLASLYLLFHHYATTNEEPAFSIKFPAMPRVIILNNAKIMKRVFQHPASTNKFSSATYLLVTQGKYGIGSSDGSDWSEQRKFLLSNLRILTKRTLPFEQIIRGEAMNLVNSVMQKLTNKNQVEIVPTYIFKLYVYRLISQLVTGNTISSSNFYNLLLRFEECVQETAKSGVLFLPCLKGLKTVSPSYQNFFWVCHHIHVCVRKCFKKHNDSFGENNGCNLIDLFVSKLNESSTQGSCFHGEIGLRHSVSTIVEVLLGGSETTPATLTWLIFYLSLESEAQIKLQKEIDCVVGTDGTPTLRNKHRMKYTQAVILETLRMSSVGPFGLIHQLSESLYIDKFVFEKNSLIIPNIYHVHHDKAILGDPHVFQPERFIENPGLNLGDYVIPFQVGKRRCVGEKLALDIIFLFVITFFQNFSVMPCPTILRDSHLKPDAGVLLLPTANKVLVINRKSELSSSHTGLNAV